MSYGQGYGNRGGGYGNRGGGNGGGYGNRPAGGGMKQKKPNQTYLKPNERKNSDTDSDFWGTIVSDFEIRPGDMISVSMYSNEGKDYGPKLIIKPRNNDGNQRQSYGNQQRGGNYGSRGGNSNNAPVSNGPELDDEVPFD